MRLITIAISLCLLGALGLAQSTLTVDVYVDGNGSSPGTVVSAANLATASHGTYVGWGVTSPIAQMTYAASRNALPGPIQVIGGSLYGANYSTQSFAYDPSVAGQKIEMFIPSGHPIVSVACWVTIGAPAGGFGLYDYFGIFDQSGHYAMFQVNNGSTFYANIESDQSGTTHSGQITGITQGSVVWMTLLFDSTNKIARLRMYNTSLVQIGSEVTVGLNPSTGNGAITYTGQNESSTAGNNTYFEDILFQWTSPTYPLLPSFVAGSAAPLTRGVLVR